jgi:hypothetical protein
VVCDYIYQACISIYVKFVLFCDVIVQLCGGAQIENGKKGRKCRIGERERTEDTMLSEESRV